jgi:ABC-type Fe3+/spermidine/putrescine transport system ATPase subunit
MDILQLIDRLEELFNDAKAVPFTHNVVIDEDRMLEIIDRMRIVIPDEVKKAQQILGQRDRFLAQAQEEAERTISLAREKAEQMAMKDNVVVEAQRRSEQIVNQARADAEATRNDADNYIVETLLNLQDYLEKTLNQVQNGIHAVQDEQLRKGIPTSPSSMSEKVPK